MSCYLRHLKDDLERRGVLLQPQNRKAIDLAIHDHVKVDYKDCPAAWSRVKGALGDAAARDALLAAVVEALES